MLLTAGFSLLIKPGSPVWPAYFDLSGHLLPVAGVPTVQPLTRFQGIIDTSGRGQLATTGSNCEVQYYITFELLPTAKFPEIRGSSWRKLKRAGIVIWEGKDRAFEVQATGAPPHRGADCPGTCPARCGGQSASPGSAGRHVDGVRPGKRNIT
jgi:hypothetical protein